MALSTEYSLITVSHHSLKKTFTSTVTAQSQHSGLKMVMSTFAKDMCTPNASR
jgi:Na+/melibiose symporter-like transporter